MRGGCPRPVVHHQGLSICVANQRRAIFDLNGPVAGFLEVLRLRQVREPLTKGLLIVLVFQTKKKIRCTVFRAIFGFEAQVEVDGRGLRARYANSHLGKTRQNTRANLGEPSPLASRDFSTYEAACVRHRDLERLRARSASDGARGLSMDR